MWAHLSPSGHPAGPIPQRKIPVVVTVISSKFFLPHLPVCPVIFSRCCSCVLVLAHLILLFSSRLYPWIAGTHSFNLSPYYSTKQRRKGRRKISSSLLIKFPCYPTTASGVAPTGFRHPYWSRHIARESTAPQVRATIDFWLLPLLFRLDFLLFVSL
jgi:hypothetical protein